MSDKKSNTEDAASTSPKARRRRRAPSDDHVKMHVRLLRAEHTEFAAEAARRGITVRQLVRERLVPTGNTVNGDRINVVQQLTQISTYGTDILAVALKAMSMCPPDAFVHMEHIGTAVMAAYEAGRRAVHASPPPQ